jgi:hypothetical protein
MTKWNKIGDQVQVRIRNVVRSGGKSKSQQKSDVKGKRNRKNKKEITPHEAVALTASIIIIVMALGCIGLVYNVFAQLK